MTSLLAIGSTLILAILAFSLRAPGPLSYVALVVGLCAVVTQVQVMRAARRMQAELQVKAWPDKNARDPHRRTRTIGKSEAGL
jgi:hypothetical protein